MRASLLALAVILLTTAAPAWADDVVGHALVVGSNAPGPGQERLAYAEDDAREVAAVLRDLGGYDRDRVRLVLAPTPAELLAAVAEVERAIAADVRAGRQVRLFFYYSGHAKASGLSLGPDELALETLRARLFATAASLTVVVLDACQSGAFSRVKGVEPAADFSYNSRARLDASGVAVLASSTASELSQESDFLRSSYFTHHLLVGLRGAADDNHDGRVSLDEAYRYTYHQTLVATSATAVGSQHVSVEVDLKGAGEIPLSFPEQTTAALALPAAAEGHVLVVRMPARAVTAELRKSKGAPVQVAVAPGRYEVLLRTDARILRCTAVAAAGATTIALDACASEAPLATTAKGGGAPLGPRWHASLVLGVGDHRGSAYTERLDDFGYDPAFDPSRHVAGTLLRRVQPWLLLGGQAAWLEGETWRRDTRLDPLALSWDTYTATATARVETGERFVLFLQGGAGLAVTRSRFDDQMRDTTSEWHGGVALDAAAGLDVIVTRGVGVTLRGSASFAPSLSNLIGDRHDTGLLGLDLGGVVLR